MDRDDEQKRQGANQSPLEIKRGARVVGPDGPVGALRQLIVSQDTGELRRLVVRGEAGLDFELPADHIASATGDEIRLTIGPRDLADHPDLARPFAPERYASREGNEFNYVEETSDPVAGGTTLTESRLYTLRITDLDAQPESGRALRQVAPLAVVGVLVGGAAGGLAYLLVRRRNAQVAQVATLMRASRLKAAWRPGMRATRARLSQLGSQDAARKASRAVSSALSDALGYANTALSDTLAYTNTLAIALSAAGRALWASRSRVPVVRLSPQAASAPMTERIQKPVRAVRRTAAARRRGARRFARRVRWLRRGFYLGIALGILYAPAPGRELRQRLAGVLRGIPGLDTLLAPAPIAPSTARGGATYRTSSPAADADLWGAPPERAATQFDPPTGL